MNAIKDAATYSLHIRLEFRKTVVLDAFRKTPAEVGDEARLRSLQCFAETI